MFPTIPNVDPTTSAWIYFGATALLAIAHARGNRLPGLSALFNLLAGSAPASPATPVAPAAPAAAPAPLAAPVVHVDVANPQANHPLVQQLLALPASTLLNVLEQQKPKA